MSDIFLQRVILVEKGITHLLLLMIKRYIIFPIISNKFFTPNNFIQDLVQQMQQTIRSYFFNIFKSFLPFNLKQVQKLHNIYILMLLKLKWTGQFDWFNREPVHILIQFTLIIDWFVLCICIYLKKKKRRENQTNVSK